MEMFCSCNFLPKKKRKKETLTLINNKSVYKNDNNNNNNNNKMITMVWQKAYYQFIFFPKFMHIFSML